MDVTEGLLVYAQPGVEHDGRHDSDAQFDLPVHVAQALIVDALEELGEQPQHLAYAHQGRAGGAWGRNQPRRLRLLQEGQRGAYVVVGGRERQVVLELDSQGEPGVVVDARTVPEGLQNTPNVLVGARNLTRNGYYDARQDNSAGSPRGRHRLARQRVIDGYGGVRREILIAHWLR